MSDYGDLPMELDYISECVRDCETHGTIEEMREFVNTASADVRERWIGVCTKVDENGHGDTIEHLKETCPTRRFGVLLCRFTATCDAFNGKTEEDRIRELLASTPDYGIPDWNRLPMGFEYLIQPAERYGRFVSEATQCDLIDSMADNDFAELERLAQRMRTDNAAEIFDKWFKDRRDEYVTCREMQMIMSLMSVMTLSDIQYWG